jgi:serine/threonine-protein kinase
MYVMLTGRPPFSGKTTLDVIQKHKYSQFDRPRMIVPDIPYWLDDVVCQLMEKDPEKRPADAFVVGRKLQEVLKKIEISTSDLTLGHGTQQDGSTVNAGGQSSGARSGASAGGHGTLMRDLFRAEVDAEQQRGSLRRLFENTWVLVGLLAVAVLIITYGVVSARIRSVDRTEESTGELGSWRREPRSEVDRVINLAHHQHDDGDAAAAERTLAAFTLLLPEGSPERERIEKLLGELRARVVEHPRNLSFVTEALDRADKLASEGKREEARAIWSSVIALYSDEPRAADDVARAQRGLKPTEKPPTSGTATKKSTPATSSPGKTAP